MVYLEEKTTNKEEYIDGDDQDGIESVTEEFIVCLVRAVKAVQQVEKHCYHCCSPGYFIHDFPLLEGAQAFLLLNWREGMVQRKGV